MQITEAEARALAQGKHPAPFEALGPSADGSELVALVPGAQRIWAVNDTDSRELIRPWSNFPIFVGEPLPYYRLRIEWPEDQRVEREDPYRFSPVLGAVDEHLISEGRHEALWKVLGAHPIVHENVPGVVFAVWAPNAARVSVVGSFNS